MLFDAYHGLELPKPVLGHRPDTFLERGAVVPYTSPHLVGARIRPGARAPLDLLVPNLAGGRGVYVLPLDNLNALCVPTLHDRALNARLARLPSVTPAAIRCVAWAIAAEGLAGAAVAAAAAAGLDDERQQAQQARVELYGEVLRQLEASGATRVVSGGADAKHLSARLRAALAPLADRSGRTADSLLALLDELAGLFQPIGIARQAASARLARLVNALDDVRLDLQRWQQICGGAGSDALIVEASASLTLVAARATLQDARAMLDDLPGLLRRWNSEADHVRRLVARPDWLLDGWERICLLWQTSHERSDRRLVLREILPLVPTLPSEAADWVDIKLNIDLHGLLDRRIGLLNADWQTAASMTELVERNERLRTLSPGGPA